MPPLAGYRKSAVKFNSTAKLQLFFLKYQFFLKKIKNRWILKLVETIISEY